MRLIVGMTGATGAPLGVALLQALRDMPEVETHLVMSKWAKTTIELETPYSARDVAALDTRKSKQHVERLNVPRRVLADFFDLLGHLAGILGV